MKIQRQYEQFQVFSSEPEELTSPDLECAGEGGLHSGATKDEKNAIGVYYGIGHFDINHKLRGTYSDPHVEEKATKYIPHIDSLMEKVKEFSRPVLLHRGIREDVGSKVFGQPGDKIGKVFHDKGYVSTATREGVTNTFGGTRVHIHAGPGTRALSADSMGNYSGENEFTFPRGQRFKVQSDTVDGNTGRRHIHVKALAQGEDEHLEHFSRFQ